MVQCFCSAAVQLRLYWPLEARDRNCSLMSEVRTCVWRTLRSQWFSLQLYWSVIDWWSDSASTKVLSCWSVCWRSWELWWPWTRAWSSRSRSSAHTAEWEHTHTHTHTHSLINYFLFVMWLIWLNAEVWLCVCVFRRRWCVCSRTSRSWRRSRDRIQTRRRFVYNITHIISQLSEGSWENSNLLISFDTLCFLRRGTSWSTNSTTQTERNCRRSACSW